MTLESRKLVSIVIPCYNAARWIEACIDSCALQTHRPIEIVVVDDGSTDDSRRLLEEQVRRHEGLLRVFSQPNAGPSVARNAAVDRCRGEYLMFLDADDLLEPSAAAVLCKTLENHPECGAAFGDLRYIDADGKEIGFRRQELEGKDPIADVICRAPEPDGVMLRAELGRRTRFDETLRYGENFEYFSRLAIAGVHFIHTPEVTARYRVHSSPARLSLAPDLGKNRAMDRIFDKLENALVESGQMTPYRRAVIHRGMLNAAMGFYGCGERAEARGRMKRIDMRIVPQAGNYRLLSLPGLIRTTNLDAGFALWRFGRFIRSLVPGGRGR